MDAPRPTSLTDDEVEQFVTDGFVRVAGAFPRALADEARAILWRDTGCDPDDPVTWTRPVVWLGDYGQAPFAAAVNTPALQAAFDRLVGAGRWAPRNSLGTFPIRFPAATDTGDGGWHIDVSFPGSDGDPADYFSWRANLWSQGRALLMLFLFSDVGADDAPTRIRVGSHLDIARMLAPEGEAGLTALEIGQRLQSDPLGRAETVATGEAGDVYLCHPFLVHAAQLNRSQRPKFMAQPPLLPTQPFGLDRTDGAYSPVESAIRLAIGRR